ncbi:MAG: J domain-containing protein [[Clostridium] innocuum]
MELEQIKGLLDLASLEDITAIKKAYAKQVKLHHPEEEPQVFQQLQTAYREAVQYAQAQRAGHAVKVNVLQEKQKNQMTNRLRLCLRDPCLPVRAGTGSTKNDR